MAASVLKRGDFGTCKDIIAWAPELLDGSGLQDILVLTMQP
jgi:hypothetical protein